MRVYSVGVWALIILAVTARNSYTGTCNLTVAGSTCTEAGALYTNILPVGTFYVDPFLEMKTASGSGGSGGSGGPKSGKSGGSTTASSTTQSGTTEQGYNTTGQVQFDTQGSGALLLTDVPRTTINGVEYREFLLDVDEPGNDPQITLEQLQIFLSPSSTLTGYETTTRTLNGLTAIYDLDSGSNSSIQLSYSLGAAQGPGTMLVYIPNSLFTRSTGEQYVYLYSQFSSAGGGLEEWWVRTSSGGMAITRTAVPEPGTLILLGSALSMTGLHLRRRRRKNQAQA